MPSPPKQHHHNAAAASRDFKHRVLTCLNRLSDRDTHSAAATELESIARTLTAATVSAFLASISATESTDKSPVRRQCVRLISLVSESHGELLSPHLSKLLAAVVRRLRDPDAAVRAACVDAAASVSCHVTKPPFAAIAKPLVDVLVTEQDSNGQIGAALCLSAAIDAAPEPDRDYLRRLVPRLEKLLKCESFRANAALLALVGSVVGAGAVSSGGVVRNLVKVLVEMVSSEDWGTRKAAAEALGKLAEFEKDLLSEFKDGCLKVFEAKRFDKVKVVRETMNQMIEAWKEIPDVPEDVSPPPESQSSEKEVASDGRYPPGGPQIEKKHSLASNSVISHCSSTTIGSRRASLDSSNRKSGRPLFRKLDHKKPCDYGLDISTPGPVVVSEDNRGKNKSASVLKKDEYRRMSETKRVLFSKKACEKLRESGASNGSHHAFKSHDEMIDSVAVVSIIDGDFQTSHRECEDLSLIHKQLFQIESQQSNLFNLLQTFIGSSQKGMRSLESRVHGLELMLDEISFDLARSSGKVSNGSSTEALCCKLPGADFLSSKLWRKAEGQYSSSRYSSSVRTPCVAALRHMSGKNLSAEASHSESLRFRLQDGGSGLISNPLADTRRGFCGTSDIPSSRVSTIKNIPASV